MPAGDPFAEIKAADPNFNEEMFYGRVNEMFVAIQYAWMARNLEPVRRFLSDQQFSVLDNGVQTTTSRKGTDQQARQHPRRPACSRSRSPREGDYDSVKMLITATCIDYTVDERTGELVNPAELGDGKTPTTFQEYWTFMRKVGRAVQGRRDDPEVPELRRSGDRRQLREVRVLRRADERPDAGLGPHADRAGRLGRKRHSEGTGSTGPAAIPAGPVRLKGGPPCRPRRRRPDSLRAIRARGRAASALALARVAVPRGVRVRATRARPTRVARRDADLPWLARACLHRAVFVSRRALSGVIGKSSSSGCSSESRAQHDERPSSGHGRRTRLDGAGGRASWRVPLSADPCSGRPADAATVLVGSSTESADRRSRRPPGRGRRSHAPARRSVRRDQVADDPTSTRSCSTGA